jgi:hypothetical protein
MVVGTWYHLAVVRSENTFILYKNGISLSQGTSSSSVGTGSSVYMGTETAEGAYLNGLLDEARIYNRALSAEEIKRHYEMSK